MLYQRDYLQLLVKYGLEPPSQLVDGTGATQRSTSFPDAAGQRRREPAAADESA